MWFDGNRILTYNTLFNFVISNRGPGKTYWFKKWAIKDFLENGKQFVYLRRYKQEIKKGRFVKQVLAEFPGLKYKESGDNILINGKQAGYVLPLSTTITQKSNNFNEVDKMCFDEFVIAEGNYRYLPRDVDKFLDFYETCNRLRTDGRRDIRVFFFGNAISLYNPYFQFFKIQFLKEKKVFRRGDIYAEVFEDYDFINAKKQSRFGKIIEGTDYADYAIDSNFYLDDDKLVAPKTGDASCWSIFTIDGCEYGVWVDYKIGKFFLSKHTDPYCLRRYCFSGKDHNTNTMLIKGRDAAVKMFVDNFKIGNVYFESMEVKSLCWDMVQKIIY